MLGHLQLASQLSWSEMTMRIQVPAQTKMKMTRRTQLAVRRKPSMKQLMRMRTRQ
jgi:Cu/Ag efflux protein CusF